MKRLTFHLTVFLLFNLLFSFKNAIAETKLSQLKDIGVSFGEGYPLYVFASPTCPYCRKFHTDVRPELEENGFEVIYLIIAHDKHKSFKRASEVYCAQDKKSQLNEFHTTLLPQVLVDGSKCKVMVEDMLRVATHYDVTSTPTIVLPDESVIKGVSSVEHILPNYIKALTK